MKYIVYIYFHRSYKLGENIGKLNILQMIYIQNI